jgi:hypothetical protein
MLCLPELGNVAVKPAREAMRPPLRVDFERWVAGLLLCEGTKADEDSPALLRLELGEASHHARIVDLGPEVVESPA